MFRRGLHCPICAKDLLELDRLAREFASRGMQVVAISSDDADRGAAHGGQGEHQRREVWLRDELEGSPRMGPVHQRLARQNVHRH